MSERDMIINQITKLDEQLNIFKPFVDEFAGKTKEDLGEEAFNDILKIYDKVQRMMVCRILLSRELLERYGMFVM